MKPLQPVLREKRRYVVFKIISSQKFSKKQVEKELTKVIFNTIGLFGAVDSGYWLVKFYENKQTGVLRVTNNYKEKVLASLVFFTEINGTKITLKLIKTTGSIKKANEIISKT